MNMNKKPDMSCNIRIFTEADIPEMLKMWNEVIWAGNAFPQLEALTLETAKAFFSAQTFTGVAEINGNICGLYILHPNNIGRCGHISNASYAVKNGMRGARIGEKLVTHSLIQAKKEGFRILQFNAVVKSNIAAIKLYQKLGFIELGTIPGGFRHDDGTFEDIISFYHTLD